VRHIGLGHSFLAELGQHVGKLFLNSHRFHRYQLVRISSFAGEPLMLVGSLA
jgi:hypothetical protein